MSQQRQLAVETVGDRDMESLRFEASETFRATPEALWPLVADTPRLNRAMGLPPINYEITPAGGGGSHIEANIAVFGVALARWTEHPFRWEAPHGYVVLREFHGGLVKRIRGGVQLTSKGGETEVRVFSDITPANPLGALLVKHLIGPRSVRGIVEQCRIFDRFLSGEATDPYPKLVNRQPLPAAVDDATARLKGRGLTQDAIERLRQHLAEARDDEVVKMRPFELADRWGSDRHETLALFLHATTAGLVVMTWDVLCPNCRIGNAEYSALRDLSNQAHCDACNITFSARFDRQVEVRFSVAPALRRVENRQFCIGGPMNTPHVVGQLSVPARASERLTCLLAPGPYRLRAGGNGELLIDALPAQDAPGEHDPARELEVIVTDDGFGPAADVVLAGEATIEVSNQTEHEQLAVLEGNIWPDTIATAAMVSTMQEFRDLFSSEVLTPGLQLGIENLAFMFTDLTGSTALYQAIGQARAFRLVQDHFRILGAAISAHRGAVVKTIGDAVMATFSRGPDALAAALQIQQDIRGLEVPEGVDSGHLVKIGLHQGACVAVNLNERLDYFGTTVNTAARIEHESRGGQIVASLAICQAPAAAVLLRESEAQLQEEVVQLRGVAEPVSVYRITPA